MPGSESSGGIISEEELKALADLFVQFEGAPDPLAQSCKEAKIEFNSRISKLYFERIKPNPEFAEWTSFSVP